MKIDQITWKVNLFYIALTHLMHCYGLDVLCAKQHAVSWYKFANVRYAKIQFILAWGSYRK